VLACCAAIAVAAAGLWCGHAQSAPAPAATAPQITASAPATHAGQQSNPRTASAEEQAHQQQIARQCADLLKLATDLKAAVDKSTKDQLSVGVVRRAAQIEKLAHKVRTAN